MSNLRVVDASVIPEVTNANINAPVMMLAEKAAESINHFYNGPETTDPVTTTFIRTIADRFRIIQSKSNGNKLILIDARKLFLIFSLIYLLWF